MVQLTHEMHARQTTSLTPRLQQSVRLLQMSTLDFTREVAQTIASNPFLEEQEEIAGYAEVANTNKETKNTKDKLTETLLSDTSTRLPAADDLIHEEYGRTLDTISTEPQTQYCEPNQAESESEHVYSGDYPSPSDPSRPGNDLGQWARNQTGLHDVLHENVCDYALNDLDRLLVELIIEALDDDGYLRAAFSDLTTTEQLGEKVSEVQWTTALQLVQHAAAPGIGARNLSECLCLQLLATPTNTPGRNLALKIAEKALEKLAKCDYSGLAKLFDCSDQALQQACSLIRGLNPRPAEHYRSVDASCYIVPDIIVRKAGKLWVAVSNHDTVPRVRLHSMYAQLFRNSHYDNKPLMAKALQEARWLIHSLEQRTSTIQRVAQAIVARQQTFFEYGEIALRPLMLSEIADELGIHESTVSRATSNKYLSSPRGVYEFKDFFSRELATRSGGTCSAVAVRALIQEMIADENPKMPLSDVTLAQKLAHEGVVVARRTVSKYRSQIKYPPADMRRAP